MSSTSSSPSGRNTNRKNKDNRRDREDSITTTPPKLLTKSKISPSTPVSSSSSTTNKSVTPSSSSSSSSSSFNIKKRESIDSVTSSSSGGHGYPLTPVSSPSSTSSPSTSNIKEETSSPQQHHPHPHYQHHHHQQIQQSIEQQSSFPLKSIKMVDKSFKISINDLLKLFTKDDGFMVIGVLGGQSTGKSTILSSLTTIHTYAKSNQNQPPPFDIQTDDNFCLGSHQTNGIDVYITPAERLVYIDTQPLQSISIVTEMIDKSAYCPPGYTSYEHYHYVQCLKMIVFLYSICNVVLVVQENKSIDLPICNLIKSALMLKNKRIPDITNCTMIQSQQPTQSDISDTSEYLARTIFVFNKLTELDYEIQSLDKTLAILLRKISFNQPIESIYIPDKFIYSSSNNTSGNQLLPSTTTPNFVPQPAQQQQDIPVLSSFSNFNESIDTLKKRLLSLKSSTKFQKPLTERNWLENVSRLFEMIQDDDHIELYNKLLITKKFRN